MGAALAARRLAAAHWVLLAVCALFLLAGALVLDDYGIGTDSAIQHLHGSTALDYLAGEGDRAYDQLPHSFINRYYGASFEVALVLVERLLGLEDSRDIFLSRHMLTHLFFLAGGVFCYLLVLRAFNNRALALVAMVLFLLHPRLYAHSFYNSKDLPFAAMFMIALYFIHRAFGRDTLAAFLLCGVGVGLLVNLRMMGIFLFAAVLALRGLDLLFAGGVGERKRILLTGGAFALGAALTWYAVFPGIWTDPIGGFIAAFQVASALPTPVYNLFRGEWLFGPDGPPFEYIPLWIGITTPPVTLLLAVIGVAGLCWRAARRPSDVWRATPLRFNLLLLAIVVALIVATFVGKVNIYNEWRHVYFLYAPLALLAVAGLHWLLSCTNHRWIRAGIHALVGASVAVVLVSMVRIHPLQDSYYNSFVDRTTPDYLASQYETGMWLQLYWNLVKEIVEDHPEQEIRFSSWNIATLVPLLPESKRVWVSRDYVIFSTGFYSDRPVSSRTYVSRIYNNTIAIFRGRQLNAGGRDAIVQAALSGEPIARSFFTIYLHDNMLVFVREECVPQEDIESNSLQDQFSIEVFPVDTAVLSGKQKLFGVEHFPHVLDRSFVLDGDGRCSWIFLLPDYPVYRFNARLTNGDDTRWEVRVGIASPVDPAVLGGEPLASADFDIHRDGDALVYVKDGCTKDDEEAEFLAFFFPVDPGDLPDEIGQNGLDGSTAMRVSFRLWNRGARFGDRCITALPLPAWPVASVRTGQYGENGWRWDVRFALTPRTVDPDVLASEPLASGEFDIHRDGDTLVYVRDGCTEDEADGAFFLHFTPVDAADLPDGSKAHGFENRDFSLWDHGARHDGRCLAVVPLPGYPVASVRTGQYDETGERWAVEFPFVRPDAIRAALSGEPVARSVFDVYRDGGTLVYVRDGCTEEEAGAAFFLHVVPVDAGDLPASRRQYGFENLDFSLTARGARTDGDCVASVRLPDYPIASVATGQYDETGQLWAVEFAIPDGE